MASSRRPSVLTMSGSSTPGSCTLVCENAGASSPAAGALTGEISWRASGGGATICGASITTRVGTPTPPWVRRALRRA
jgi:hypothetical protein